MPRLTVPFDPVIGPIADVVIAPPDTIHTGADAASRRARTYKALVDTGAEITCITQEIAREVGLRVTGIAPMASASGTHNANLYIAYVYVPLSGSGARAIGLICNAAQVLEVSGDRHYQALLGRDVLERVTFTLDGPGRRFTLEIPSGS